MRILWFSFRPGRCRRRQSDSRFRFRSDVSRPARFFQPTDDEEEEEAEYEDIVVQLPAWSPPPPPRRHQRSRSFPRRWNPSGGGLRRAAGRLIATNRLVGRRSVPSSSTSWDGRRALEQALLFAAVVPLRASADERTTSTTVESERCRLDADDVTATGPLNNDDGQRTQSESTQNSFDNDSILSP